MDLDRDGHVDFVTATYDGSPHIAYGTADGFAEPQHLLDSSGERIILDQYWDDAKREWTGLSRGGAESRHAISAVVFDLDGDGDRDLLLGDKNLGNLYVVRNEGSPGEPAFTSSAEEVLAGGESFALHNGMTAPRLVDWDGDGRTDLVCGSFGERDGAPGGIYWYRNVGTGDAAEFAKAETLYHPTKSAAGRAGAAVSGALGAASRMLGGSERSSGSEPQARPDVPARGLYADPVDYDGDGDLDLLVGGYAYIEAEPVELDDQQRERLREVQQEIETLTTKIRERIAAIHAKPGLDDEQRLEQVRGYYSSDTYRAVADRLRALRAESEELDPQPKWQQGIWLLPREGTGSD